MVVFLVLLTLVVCLGIEAIRRKASLSTETEPAPVPARPAPSMRERLYHPGHTWVQIEDAATVTVGIDDFAGRFLGTVDRIEVRKSGTVVRQGELLATLRRKDRGLSVVAPVSGVLLNANPGLSEQPSIVNGSPYEKGWIAKIRPSSLEVEIRNLLRGAVAEKWRDGLRAQMGSWFAPKLGVVLQDGGEWIDSVSDLLSDEEWHKLARILFPVLPPDPSKS